uniref:Pleckstrin homology domain containing, family A member 7b n=1 Tax=Pygocentrus nattereri TaxID=42514 RepID=A0AAR2JBV8_PYGNA
MGEAAPGRAEPERRLRGIMAAPLQRDTLPEHWSYGVCRDGRVFFIDDETRSTTWLHPRTGEPVNSGHMIRSDLPKGWEEGFTKEGASFFIDHNQRTTVFRHPVTGQLTTENTEFRLQEQPSGHMPKLQATLRPSSTVSEASTTVTSSTLDTTPVFKGSRSSGRVHSFGKRDSAIKRNPNVPVVMRGWLYKQDSSGMRLWRRKWFVLADYCLFYYKGKISLRCCMCILQTWVCCELVHTGMRSYIYKHSSVVGSQAEHSGMRTYFFSADTQDDMNSWVRAMNQAALMQNHTVKRSVLKVEKQAIRQINHIQNYVFLQAEASQNDRTELQKQEVRGKSPGVRTLEVELSAPEVAVTSHAPSCIPSRAASTLPASFRSGVTVEQNGLVEYQRGPTPHSDTPTHTQGRKSTLEQVENWVKVQKGEAISSEGNLSRQNPPVQSNFGAAEAQQFMSKSPYHSPPNSHRQLTSDYKYAQDRISHFRAAQGQPFQPTTRDGTVWQLYEWQQRQQYRHASPTAPIYVPAPDYSTAVSSTRVNPDVARSVSVPPTPADIPPPGPPGPSMLSPRRPHTPAERVTVKPLGDRPMVEVPPSSSPHRIYSQKSATIERRSIPPSGYITHTVSTPSLHGKTADDTYVQLKKDLEYLDLKVGLGDLNLDGPIQYTFIFLFFFRSLFLSQDKLESVLDVSHQQMEQYQDQPAHTEKIAYQQRLLQEDLVHIRAEISRVATEMERAWEEYGRLEQSVQLLREALQAQMNLCTVPQEKTQLKRELWRIEDVMAGLSSTKDTFKITIDSMQNPGRKLVPSVTELPSRSATPAEIRTPQRSLTSSPLPMPSENSSTQLSQSVPKWVCAWCHQTDVQLTLGLEDTAPPRPPLPLHYSEDIPPAIPPLPKETSIIRHTSVRGLKRQSDERKRDREYSYVNGDCRVELRSYLSEPELPGSKDVSDQTEGGYRTLPNRGFSSSTDICLMYNCTSSVFFAPQERPKSALEQLYSEEPRQLPQRGRMSVEEQLERMKRHQRALVRERKRNLNQAERLSASSQASSRTICSDLGPLRREQGFDLQLSGRIVQTAERQGQEEHSPQTRPQKTDEWLTVLARPMIIDDLEPVDFDVDLSRELSIPPKISIPKRFQETEPEEPLSQEEKEERIRNVQKIKNLLAKSSIPPALLPIGSEQLDFSDLDHVLQQQEQIRTFPQKTLCTEGEIVGDL